jgi:hypothetical protein
MTDRKAANNNLNEISSLNSGVEVNNPLKTAKLSGFV